eukprot:TRINITY_DN7279_c0_g1_i1.p1 TRINITY_DN7279_c0_g1~~TRINITY_DN7279_c0_g1_i1.p1  ORF type:complete len:1005 (-),score=220.99 TRINITY_DN7279_c0_g1_i1:54-3068(-)
MEATCTPIVGKSAAELCGRVGTLACGVGEDTYSNRQQWKKKTADVVAGKGRKSETSRSVSSLTLDLPPLEQDYELDAKSATEAGFGTGLRRFVHKKTRMPRAVLTLKKRNVPKDVSLSELDKQMQLLCKIDHPNIVPFRECCEDAQNFHLIYEWCEGGPLMYQLWRYDGMLSEGHIAQIIREILSALVAASVFGVHHLDLGLFSIFLNYAESLSPVKVFGIGLAGFITQPVSQRKVSRTNKHYYCSPELFNTGVKALTPHARHASDMWAVATMLFTFCSGRPPFGAGSIKDIAHRVQGGRWTFGIEFADYSGMLKDMLETVLKVDWKKRPSAQELLEHAWVQNTQTLSLKDGKINQMAMQQLKSYAQADHIKQTVARMLTDIGLTIDAYKSLEEKFREMDLNGDGTITLGELVEVSTSLGISETEMNLIVSKLDRNGNCNVDISEFIAALVMEQEEADERLIRKAFSKMDKNGDARVTKKELFTVLRQYSGTVHTNEVSDFVGKADDDGDQKIDYREFTQLFPQVRGRYEELNRRYADASRTIAGANMYLEHFKRNVQPWLHKIEHQRDKFEIACGMRDMPEHLAAGASYSYEKGQISEFDVQVMVRTLQRLLHEVPGHDYGCKKVNKKAKADKHHHRKKKQELKEAREAAQKEKSVQMIGMTMLSAKSGKAAGEVQQLRRSQSGSGDSGNSSGSDDEAYKADKGTDGGVHTWKVMYEKDMRLKKTDATFNTDAYWFVSLYWLLKVRGERIWQQPLKECIKEMREACVEDVFEATIRYNFELSRLKTNLDEHYVLREDTRFDDSERTLKAGSRMLPLGVMEGKNLKTKNLLDKLDTIDLPVNFYFGHAKDEVTHQRIEIMQQVHMQKLVWVAGFATNILSEVNSLVQGVAEDITMSSSLEGTMPSPPPMSHLFLKYCEGRELDMDATTPREEEALESDEEQQEAELLAGADVSMSKSVMGQSTLASGLASSATLEVRAARKRIERNQILTKQANETRMKQEAKK